MYSKLYLFFGKVLYLALSHTYLLSHMSGKNPEAREETAGGGASEETASG